MSARDILDALACARPSCVCKKGSLTHCPAHDDANPSFSVSDKNGMTLFKCHSGCEQQTVVAALTERRLFGEEIQRPVVGGMRLTKSYEFKDADGNVVAYHDRFDGPVGKTFKWRRASGEEGLGFPEHDLPLYRLHDVLTSDGPVWVVEGEKAADACAEQGLTAVSLPGGAAQKRFGNALDVLSGREVILWPDNDEPGRGLMQRIAGYLPEARTVSPTLAAKGDAYDYFANGGTLEALRELTTALKPQARVLDSDTVIIDYPITGGAIQFRFSQFYAKGRDTEAALVVHVDYAATRGMEYSTHINCSSPSSRNTIRLEIEKFFDVKEIAWPRAVATACSMAERAWKAVDASVDLFDVPAAQERKYLVQNFAPLHVATIPFGMGGSGKSYLTLDVALHCLFGEPWMGCAVEQVDAIYIVDYEDSEDEWRLRVDQLCEPHGWNIESGQIHYIPGRGVPLVEQSQQLMALVKKHGPGVLIVDSAVSACGGLAKDEVAVARLCNLLTELGRHGVTSLLIAHNTKDENSQYPFGSIFWHNLVRATHFIEAHQVDGASDLDWLIWNRKANRGKQRPISARVSFSPNDGPVHIREVGVGGNEASADFNEASVTTRILMAMRELGRAGTVAEIAALAKPVTAGVIRTMLPRWERRGEYVTRAGLDGRAQLWGLLADVERSSSATVAATSETVAFRSATSVPPFRGTVAVAHTGLQEAEGGEKEEGPLPW